MEDYKPKKGGCLMTKYLYNGPVMEFGICVASNYIASTYAESEKKARSNMTYKYKKYNNKVPGTKIDLPGKIVAVS